MNMRYTTDNIADELKKLLNEDIPENYKQWARDGMIFIERNPRPDILDFPNNIYGYTGPEEMPEQVRELIEGILMEGIAQGRGPAALAMGNMYYTGVFREQSFEKALAYYETAEKLGHEHACENMAFCHYRLGNYQKAYDLFARGAYLGRVSSLYMIADMYRYGQYLEKNEEEAYRIYSRCVDLINADPDEYEYCDADVHVRYGDCMIHGTGCQQDLLRGMYWAQSAELSYRRQEQLNVPFAREGIDRAVRLVNECRYILDSQKNAKSKKND